MVKIDNNSKISFMKNTQWRDLTMTDSAAQQIHRLIENDKNVLGLRIKIKKSGCAGFSYVLDKATYYDNTDLIYEHNGARLYVSIQVIPFIEGTELDYLNENLNQKFRFNNPKSQNTCGCGESFSLLSDESL